VVDLLLGKGGGMTEAQWRASADPLAMLGRARLGGLLGERKRLAFLTACLRRLWPLLLYRGSREAVEVLERAADRAANDEEWSAAAAAARAAADSAQRDADNLADPDGASAQAIYAAHAAARAVHDAFRNADADFVVWAVNLPERGGAGYCPLASQAAFLRDLFGPLPFRLLPPLAPRWLRWGGGTVRRLAEAAYGERRLPEGTLDPTSLAVLADALEEAGCDQANLLTHLRGPGEHVRGCWALDLLLAGT
jgi:hypothetical protein